MSRTPPPIAAWLILLLFVAPARGERPARFEPLQALETGIATLDIEGVRAPIPYSRTIAGPRFALQPVVARLGGTLEIGPLRQRHQLEVTGTVFLFGPGAGFLTSGETIQTLSQPPGPGEGGLHVPLDLMHWVYTRLMGFEFRWNPSTKLLIVARQPLREIPVTLDVVNLQGVTTLVFQFPITPRYEVERSPSRIRIDFVSDRIDIRAPRVFPDQSLVRDLRLTPRSIIIDLASRSSAQDYVLDSPFRLVFDIVRDASAPTLRAETPEPRQRGRLIKTIVIDPGHGGSDTGAIGASGTQEKDLTLTLARALRRRLRQRLSVETVLTRDRDVEIPLDSRSALANQYKGDLFVSIHLNSSPTSRSRGAETYFLNLEASDESAAEVARLENQADVGDPLYDLQLILWSLAQTRYMASSQRLASFVQEELNTALGLRDRGVKQAPFRVLVGVAMPAVLVELGFLSNPDEERRLREPAYQGQLVESLVRAVSRFMAETRGDMATIDQPAEP